MKKRLFYKLMASFGVVLLLFTLVLAIIFLSMFRRETLSVTEQTMLSQARAIAATVAAYQDGTLESGILLPSAEEPPEAKPSSSAVAEPKGKGKHAEEHGKVYRSYLSFLDAITSDDVWIVDKESNIITYGSQSAASTEELPENAGAIINKVLTGEEMTGTEFTDTLDKPSLTVGVPVKLADGSIGGAVLMHAPVSGISQTIRNSMNILRYGILIAILFAGIAAFFLSWRFSKPLEKMRAAAGRLTHGAYEARTGVRRNDEIGLLAESIDTLAGTLEEAREERIETDRMKDEFIAAVSHELRTPVAVLRGSLELIHDGTVTNPTEIESYTAQMLSETKHMERLVNDLLELSRLKNPSFTLSFEEADLNDIVLDAVRAMRPVSKQKGLDIVPELIQKPVPIQADYGRLRQLIIILLDNAVKFSDGSKPVRIETSVENRTIVLRVLDDGMRIPEEDRRLIFERFVKSQESINKNGSGLGLALAGEIAGRHHASISAGEENGSTVFSVLFPISPDDTTI